MVNLYSVQKDSQAKYRFSKKEDRSMSLSMALEMGSSIICYALVIFGLETSESVPVSLGSENNFANEEKRENSLENSAFVDCSTPDISPGFTIKG